MKMIISGGGTGGHIFPAIAIAEAVRRQRPAAEVLFVGAEGKMEMEKVPAAGYKIIGLPVVGLQRRLTLKNLAFPFKLWRSMRKARGVIRNFNPDVVVGVGGYASGPIVRAATSKGVPGLIQEQNSFAGLTNRILSKRVRKICVAYDNVKKFFPADKIVFTGNPVRKDIVDMSKRQDIEALRAEAAAFYGLDLKRKTIFITGGSLGARTLNDACREHIDLLNRDDIQVIWQVGKLYLDEFAPLAEGRSNIRISAFIERMDLAYALADVVVARAGALTIAELCVLGKASILIPSPNVAEDHQTANARELSEKGAAVLIKDIDARNDMIVKVLELISDSNGLVALSSNAQQLGIPDAADRIANEILKIVDNK